MLLLGEIMALNCTKQFQRFKKHFGKTYENETAALNNFCTNLDNLPFYRRINSNMDVIVSEHLNYRRGGRKSAQVTEVCQRDYCSATPLTNLDFVYQSVDLRVWGLVTRAKDQGGCGACYMFGATVLLENALLLDQNFVTQTIRGNARQVNISELYGLTNT